MEVDEKATKREKEERELLVREEKTEGGWFLANLESLLP